MKKLKNRQETSKGNVTLLNSDVPSSHMDRTPKFSFKYLTGKYCLSKCELQEKAALSDALHTLSKKKWIEIRSSNKHKGGCEKIAFNATKGIAEKFSNKTLLAIRFSGKKPMLGFQDKEVFYILALDRSFTCYSHG